MKKVKVSDTVTRDVRIVTKVKSVITSVKRQSTKKSSPKILSFVTSAVQFIVLDAIKTIKTLSLIRRL